MLTYLKKFKKETIIIAVVTVLCIIVTGVMSANFLRYRTEKKVKVSAQVTSIEYYDHSSGDTSDTGYEIFGDYSYGANDYEHILLDTVSAYPDYSEGDYLDVYVYANSPGEVAVNTFPNAIFFLAASIFLTVLSIKKIKQEMADIKAAN